MKKNKLTLKVLLILLACASMAACTSVEHLPPQNISIDIGFDPDMDLFEGTPGDELPLGVTVNIEGDANEFHSLVLERIENANIIYTDTLSFSNEGIPSPFQYDYLLVLGEEDANKDFQLRFTVSHKRATPSGGTVSVSKFKTLSVNVKPID